MFDIAFSEIVVIAVVALIVIGPERLPKTARMLGHLFGRLQRYVTEVKADISREMELDELRKLQQEVHSAAREIETSMHSAMSQVDSSVRSVEAELNQAGSVAHGAGTVAGGLPAPAEPPEEFVQPAAAPAPAVTPGPASAAPSPAPTGPSPAAAASPDSITEPPRQPSLPGLDRP